MKTANVFCISLILVPCLHALGTVEPSPLDNIVPRPVRASLRTGRCAAAALRNPAIVSGAVHGVPAETADEAYRLEISEDGAVITAPTRRAEIWARRTLDQYARLSGGKSVANAVIVDWPRYPWRGWMIDTGRNFVEIDDLKLVIDHMSAYKMNLFHWHLTEYYGWRLESRVYPQLQKPESFYLRDVGRYYTQAEFRELVDYAAGKGVTVMPEFDVPGHALAFRRAFGFETMRDEGVRERLCGLIDELCSLVPAGKMPFVHLGSDEARLPEEKVPSGWMSVLADRVAAAGRTVVGWLPGELKGIDFKGEAVAMLWARPKAEEIAATRVSGAFDGGGYYIETYDPFELPAVASYRATCGWDASVLRKDGVIACCWHDERAASGRRVLVDQDTAPAITMLSDAFWCGRDEDLRGFHRRLPLAGDPRLAKAEDLERRVAAQRDLVFPGTGSPLPFSFLRQTDMRWRIAVNGETVATNVAQATMFVWQSYTGGVESAGEDMGSRGGCFSTNRSGVAVLETWIKSPADMEAGAWIGFTAFDLDHGRAYAGGTPRAGEWSRHGAKVELNGETIPPPAWKNPGLNPGKDVKHLLYVRELDEIPYSDEEYYMREPTPIRLKKGWNHVKLTAPMDRAGYHKQWAATFAPLLGTTERPREIPGLEYRSSPPPASSL